MFFGGVTGASPCRCLGPGARAGPSRGQHGLPGTVPDSPDLDKQGGNRRGLIALTLAVIYLLPKPTRAIPAPSKAGCPYSTGRGFRSIPIPWPLSPQCPDSYRHQPDRRDDRHARSEPTGNPWPRASATWSPACSATWATPPAPAPKVFKPGPSRRPQSQSLPFFRTCS